MLFMLPALVLAGAAAAAPEIQSPELVAIRNAAQRGDAGAELLLALTYLEGRDSVAPDVRAGVHWLRAAAVAGQPYAQYRLGDLYHTGKGVAKNEQQAVSWWRKAASQGI
ncbi:MAG: hypothetical protein AMS22_17630, partial [Thiotrichales bacterium SG8_50]